MSISVGNRVVVLRWICHWLSSPPPRSSIADGAQRFKAKLILSLIVDVARAHQEFTSTRARRSHKPRAPTLHCPHVRTWQNQPTEEDPSVFEIILESSYNFLSAEYSELFAGSRASAFQHPLWLDRLYAKLARRLECRAARDHCTLAPQRPIGDAAPPAAAAARRRAGHRVCRFAGIRLRGAGVRRHHVCPDRERSGGLREGFARTSSRMISFASRKSARMLRRSSSSLASTAARSWE